LILCREVGGVLGKERKEKEKERRKREEFKEALVVLSFTSLRMYELRESRLTFL